MLGVATGEGYREGRPELYAYVAAVLSLIGLGVLLTSIVLNWIIGPTTAVLLVLGWTWLFRRIDARRRSAR